MKLDVNRTFGSFVVDRRHERVIQTLRQSLRHSTQRNPVLLSGPSGVGKTHLLHAMANGLIRRRPGSRLRMLTADEYCNEYVSSIRSASVARFKCSLDTECDALFIDAMEDFVSKEATLEGLGEIVGTLVARRCPVVLACSEISRPSIAPVIATFPTASIIEIRASGVGLRLNVLRRMVRSRKERVSSWALEILARDSRTIPEAIGLLYRHLLSTQLRLED